MSRMGFDSSGFRKFMLASPPEDPTLPNVEERVYYGSMRELVEEWQKSEDVRPLWEYLGISESIFKDWLIRSKKGEIDS